MATKKEKCDEGHNHRLSIRLECRNQVELLEAAKRVLHHFGTHFVSMAMGEATANPAAINGDSAQGAHTLVAYITPLDPQLFKPREGVQFIGQMVRECLPFRTAEVVRGSIRLHYEKGGRV